MVGWLACQQCVYYSRLFVCCVAWSTLWRTLLHSACWCMLCLLALNITRRALVLTVVTTHVSNLAKVDINLATRHHSYVTHNRVVVWVLVVELVALIAHITGYIEHLLVDITLRNVVHKMAHELLRVLAVMFIDYAALRIWQLFGTDGQILA